MREPTILRYVSIVYRYSQMYIAKRLKGSDIGPGQYPFILRICRKPGISQEELSEELVIDKGTTAKAVKALAASGHIRIENDPGDKRVHRLFATRKGELLRDVIAGIIDEWRGYLGKDLTPEENARVNDLVKRMAVNAAAAVRDPR